MKLFVALVLFASSAYAQTPGQDIVISGGGISIVVRGSGGFVCSAQDTFVKQPRLGRGMTRAEAEANAQYLAAQTTRDGSGFFVKTMSCEPSQTGAGGISIQSNGDSLRVIVEGPSQVQCISKNSMARDSAFPYIANAATQTEAYALSLNACTVGSNDGMFCKTSCERVSLPGTPNGQIQIPNVKLPKLPKIVIPGIHL